SPGDNDKVIVRCTLREDIFDEVKEAGLTGTTAAAKDEVAARQIQDGVDDLSVNRAHLELPKILRQRVQERCEVPAVVIAPLAHIPPSSQLRLKYMLSRATPLPTCPLLAHAMLR